MNRKGFLAIFLCVVLGFTHFYKANSTTSNLPKTPIKSQPDSPNINEYIFGHKSYEQIISLFKDWEEKAPDLVDIGTYGKTSKGKDTYYLKLSNELKPGNDIVLITACIHGNEPLSTSTMLAYVGKLLSEYGKNEKITEMVNTKTIYFVPVVSPDTYALSRSVDNVDPNRDFPTLKNPNKISVTPIKNLQEFFIKIKPKSVLSGHTFGRVFLIPWGDSKKDNPNQDDYKKIATEMSKLANYKNKKASELYGYPIFGTETDWYYRNGAFAMVVEFGTHQRKASIEDTKKEFDRTFDSFIYFVENSVKVEIKN